MHADAGGVVAGERRERARPEAGMRVLQRAHVVRAHAHHLGGEGQAVALLVERQHVLAHQLRLAFAGVHEVRLDRIALVATAVLAGEDAAVIIDHAVFFTACGFHVLRSAHNSLLGMLDGEIDRQ